MSATSKIEWTSNDDGTPGKTWNPVRGCSIVSPGCVNCYAMKQAHRFSGGPNVDRGQVVIREAGPYHGLTKQTTAGPQWTGVVRTVESALLEPLSWRKPQRVFVDSMSDLFHEDVPDAFIDQVFAVMALNPRHTFQILTKRAERMRSYLDGDVEDLITRWADAAITIAPLRDGSTEEAADRYESVAAVDWPLPNVWLGVSVENQKYADERIPLLLQMPAAVRFISAEPLLGPVNVEPFVKNTTTYHVSVDVDGALANQAFDFLTDNGRPLTRAEAEAGLRALVAKGVKRISSTDECVGFSDQTGCPGHRHPRLDWIIVGGESGPGSRPFDLAWARSIVRQCKVAGVACFVKQLGAHPYESEAGVPPLPRTSRERLVSPYLQLADRKGGDIEEWPEHLRVREFPEARA